MATLIHISIHIYNVRMAGAVSRNHTAFNELILSSGPILPLTLSSLPETGVYSLSITQKTTDSTISPRPIVLLSLHFQTSRWKKIQSTLSPVLLLSTG